MVSLWGQIPEWDLSICPSFLISHSHDPPFSPSTPSCSLLYSIFFPMQKLFNRVLAKPSQTPPALGEVPPYMTSANFLEVIPFSYSDLSTPDPLSPQRSTTPPPPDYQPQAPMHQQSLQTTPPLNTPSQAPPPPQSHLLQSRRQFQESPFANGNAQSSNEAVKIASPEDLQEKDNVNVGVRVSLSRRRELMNYLGTVREVPNFSGPDCCANTKYNIRSRSIARFL